MNETDIPMAAKKAVKTIKEMGTQWCRPDAIYLNNYDRMKLMQLISVGDIIDIYGAKYKVRKKTKKDLILRPIGK